jgi:GTP-binding protein
MSKPPYQQARFIMSAAAVSQCPPDEGREIAFVGRSNSGKSTAINTICSQRQLARASNTPGRTQLINFFGIDDTRRLVDLPGYGYAKASREAQQEWQGLIDGYLQARQCLRGLVLLMDCRHPLQEIDDLLLDWARSCELPVLALLSKADKLGYGAGQNVRLKVIKAINNPQVTVQLFSSTARTGLEEAYDWMDEKLELVSFQK